jgi:hypothetical protein
MSVMWSLVVVLQLVIWGAHGFSMVEEAAGQQVLEQDEFTVLCRADSFYEFCIFISPVGERCEFEWKRKVGDCRSYWPSGLHPRLPRDGT